MKTFIYFSICLCLFSTAFGAVQFSLPSSWQKVDEKKDVVVFKDSSNDRKTLTVAWLDLGKASLTKANYKSEVEKMEASRRNLNQYIGLENWKITKSDFQEGKQKTLSLEGSYVKDGVEYSFWERQVFTGKKYYQMKLESPRAKAPSMEEISKTFAAIGISNEG